MCVYFLPTHTIGGSVLPAHFLRAFVGLFHVDHSFVHVDRSFVRAGIIRWIILCAVHSLIIRLCGVIRWVILWVILCGVIRWVILCSAFVRWVISLVVVGYFRWLCGRCLPSFLLCGVFMWILGFEVGPWEGS
jgi:hypothetical protein